MIIRGLILLGTLILLSCTQQPVKGEIPTREQLSETLVKNQKKQLAQLKTTNTYQSDYEVFRYNLLTGQNLPYTSGSTPYLQALRDEFDSFSLDPDSGLQSALRTYAELILADPSETNLFILQRAGIVYYKLGNHSRANSFLAECLMRGAANPELFYYKALLSAYHQQDFRSAAWYLKRIPLDKSLIPPQDILYFLGRMEEELGDMAAAERWYLSSLQNAPSRFYIMYDLLPFYTRWQNLDRASSYIKKSSDYLSSLKDPRLLIKGLSQLLEYKHLSGTDSLQYHFSVDFPYDYYPNLYLFAKSPGLAAKRLSQGLDLPINEQKKVRTDVLMYLTMEDLYDSPELNSLVILGGGLTVSNVRYLNKRLYTPVTKHFFYTNVIALMSPTNQVFILTNTARSTNHPEYVTTNVNNSLYKETLAFDYLLDFAKVDMDGDMQREYVVIGIAESNRIGLAVFNPVRRLTEMYYFTLKNHDARLYIQDTDGDRRKELILLDDQVYYLKPASKIK